MYASNDPSSPDYNTIKVLAKKPGLCEKPSQNLL